MRKLHWLIQRFPFLSHRSCSTPVWVELLPQYTSQCEIYLGCCSTHTDLLQGGRQTKEGTAGHFLHWWLHASQYHETWYWLLRAGYIEKSKPFLCLQALHYSIGTCSKQMLVILNIIHSFPSGYKPAIIYTMQAIIKLRFILPSLPRQLLIFQTVPLIFILFQSHNIPWTMLVQWDLVPTM